MSKQNKKHTVCRLVLMGCLLSWWGSAEARAAQSVLYGGGPLYAAAATHRELIRGSGFTTVVIWTIHVEADGDLVLNNHKIVDDGAYVGRAEWPAEVAAFKSGSTSVSRIELGLSGHESATFMNIRDLVFSQGTGTNGMLHRNFKVIRDVIPAIDAFNYDEESHIYEVNVPYTMKEFSLMLADLGFHIVLDVFCCAQAWTDVFNYVNGQRPGTIDRIDLQCYAGGGGNDPCWWNGQFGGLRVTPGLWAYPASESGGYWSRNPSQVESQMRAWDAACAIAGGFMWYLDDMLLALDQYQVAEYGRAINHALGIDPRRGIAATLYQHTDYWGWSVEVGVGPYGALEISDAGGQIEDVSSLKVRPGWKVTLYSEANFWGNTLVITNSDSSLVDDGWNDAVKSLVIRPLAEPPVTLYQHTNHWGWAADFDVGAYTLAQIVAAGGLNDDASSIKIAPGYSVTLYEHDNFLGRTLVKTADDASLVNDGWNDVASSLTISIDPAHGKPVTLYQDAGYWGGWSAGFGVGAYNLSQIVAAGGLNDDVTSIKVAPGYTVKFYEHDHFQGATLVKTADDICLYDDGWNDRISSLIVSGPPGVVGAATFIPAGSSWKYFDQPSDLGMAWRSSAYNDTAWSNGPARLGYGDDGEVTAVASNRQWTTYFRHQFYVPNPGRISGLNARLTRDDAAVLFLNGVEIWRDTNLPPGVITNQTAALSALGSTNETGWLPLELPPSTVSLLQPGWNLLAAEVHNQSLASSDLGFDFELAAAVFLVPQPPLGLSGSGPGLTLTWSQQASFFELYSATNLALPLWLRATNEPTFSNGAWLVPLPHATTGQRFFRLQRP